MRTLATIAAFLVSLATHAATITGKVVSVADGDTITILDANKRQTKIRFHGIDTPETGQPFGTQAKRFTSAKTFGKTVSVIVKDKDSYGRTVGVVMAGNENVNLALVRAGLAWWYQRYAPNDKSLQSAEQTARKARRGMWSQPSPVAPWDWRRGSRPTRSSSATNAHQTIAGYWLTASSSKRHNSTCRYYQKTKGRACGKTDGIACKICGG